MLKVKLIIHLLKCLSSFGKNYGEKYVEECIESLINQTYQNFEIIFFDDCSKDNSLNL